MAEGRMLSKRISRSDKLAALKSDTSRMIYTWLIPYLDVEGRLEANVDLLKADIAPLLKHITPKIIQRILIELHDNELILLYNINDKQYLQLVQFDEHQKNLRKDREAQSKIPEPTPESLRTNSGLTPSSLPPNIREVKIREEKEKYADAVFLSKTEYKKLQEAIGQKSLDVGIEKLDYSITVKSGKYKDHYKTILNWHKRGFLNADENPGKPQPPKSVFKKHTPGCGEEYMGDLIDGKYCPKCLPRDRIPPSGIKALTGGIG